MGMYAGVDPTGPSLHIGHMLPLMILAWGYVWGLPVTFLVSYCKPECSRGRKANYTAWWCNRSRRRSNRSVKYSRATAFLGPQSQYDKYALAVEEAGFKY